MKNIDRSQETNIILENIENDIIESFNVDKLKYHTEIDINKFNEVNLVTKLKMYPDGDFIVAPNVMYRDKKWVYPCRENITPPWTTFNSRLVGSNDLKRMLTYYYIPTFHPFGTITSYRTTHNCSRTHTHLEKHVFKKYSLNVVPEHINLLTADMINKSLDDVRDNVNPTAYKNLYELIKMWIYLSEQKLITAEYCLNIPMRFIDNKERERDVINNQLDNYQGWSAFSEDELAALIEYSLFWTEKALPKLLKIKNFLINIGVEKSKYPWIRTRQRYKEFEKILNLKIDKKIICNYNGGKYEIKRKKTYKAKSGEIKVYPYTEVYWHYTWRRNYSIALEHIRNAILILFALITGLRKSEICTLTFHDIFKNENNEWSVNAARFKTSVDPNFFGEIDKIPTPEFIGEIINKYKNLRSLIGFMRKGFLFESVKAPRGSNLMDRTITRAFFYIGEMLKIDTLHIHRCRKTIAEILINRSERNIDIIRMLFGHKSYAMTLRYIARNPFMVESVLETLAQTHSASLNDVVKAIRKGSYSGSAAEDIAKNVSIDSDRFAGKMLRQTLSDYVLTLLDAGLPLFIQRTILGTYCFNTNKYTIENPPPCLKGRNLIGVHIYPDPSNCQIECENTIVLQSARNVLKQNIKFYLNLLENSKKSLNNNAIIEIKNKIQINRKHLNNLSTNRPLSLHLSLNNG